MVLIPEDRWPDVSLPQAQTSYKIGIEVTEERFPFFIRCHELRADSGGAGAWRGGLGATCDLVYEGTEPALLNTAGDGMVVPPFGLFGADPGLAHHCKIVSNGADRVLGSKEVGVEVNPGDHVYCLSSGGGGYGDHPGPR